MNRKVIILTILLCIPIICTIIYFSIFRSHTVAAYNNEAPEWFNSIINWIYPRFSAEKTRFSLAFFLNKTDQIIIRLWIVFGLMSLIYSVTTYWTRWKTLWIAHWSKSMTIEQSRLIISIFCILLLITTSDWWYDFYRIESIAPFYKPILLYKAIGLSLPSSSSLIIMYSIMVIGAVMSIISYKPMVSFTITIILFIYLQGLFYCFEKIDHGYVTFTYGGICSLILILINNSKTKLQELPKWPIILAQTLIALVYFQAGLEKLMMSNFSWATSGTLQSYLIAHPTEAGLWLADSDFLCQVFSWTTLIMQLTFPIILFKPKLKWIYLGWGALFHFGTTYLMDISSYLNPWVFAYIFFIDWSLLPKYSILKKNLKRIKQDN